MGAVFGGDDGEGMIGMETQSFMLEMPLLSLLHFQDSLLPIPPEEIVRAMLDQVHKLKN